MAPEFIDADVGGMVRLMVLVDDYWHSVADHGAATLRVKLSAEIRLVAAKYGLAPDDRGRLHWEIDRGEEAKQRAARRRGSPTKPKPDDEAPDLADAYAPLIGLDGGKSQAGRKRAS
jgi:hypothetical protein